MDKLKLSGTEMEASSPQLTPTITMGTILTCLMLQSKMLVTTIVQLKVQRGKERLHQFKSRYSDFHISFIDITVHWQVLFPSEILSLEKNTLQSGRGFETEVTCVVTGEPQPRVIWYKDGQILNITSHSRTEYQTAGSKHILIIHNTQGSDFGTYMCYASNSIGELFSTMLYS